MDTLTVLMDNTHNGLRTTISEHGLSFLLKIQGKQFLFDTGATGKFLLNAQLMNEDLHMVDTVILSHSHYDHSGGLRTAAEHLSLTTLITGVGFFHPKYLVRGPFYNYHGCGFDQKYINGKGLLHTEVPECLLLAEGVYIVGGFHHYYAFETTNPLFVIKQGDDFVPDTFQDEIACVLDGPQGLTLITGCSHPGILSMIVDIKKRFNKPVWRVIGGAHLSKETPERLALTCDELVHLGVKETFFCHCSGPTINAMLQDVPRITSYALTIADQLIL